MKKSLVLLFLMGLLFSVNLSFAQEIPQSENSDQTSSIDRIVVYYFHGTRSCVTCKAVGQVSKELVETRYGDNEKVEFIEVDYDLTGNEELVEKFQVTGSGLYVYNGVESVNLTAFAFQYAKTDSKKLQKRLIKLIDKNL